MLVSVLELLIPPRLRLILAQLSVVASAIVLLACSFLNAPAAKNSAVNANPATNVNLLEDLPTESENEGDPEKNAELEADTQSLLFAGLMADDQLRPILLNSKAPAFLPLRSREFERELFRPPQ